VPPARILARALLISGKGHPDPGQARSVHSLIHPLIRSFNRSINPSIIHSINHSISLILTNPLSSFFLSPLSLSLSLSPPSHLMWGTQRRKTPALVNFLAQYESIPPEPSSSRATNASRALVHEGIISNTTTSQHEHEHEHEHHQAEHSDRRLRTSTDNCAKTILPPSLLPHLPRHGIIFGSDRRGDHNLTQPPTHQHTRTSN
jgi:hypothetical protein